MGVAWHLQDSKTCLAQKMAGGTKVSTVIYCLWHINYSTSHENGTSYLSKFIQSASLTWRSHRWALWGRRQDSVMATTKPPREALHGRICFLLQARRHTHIHQYIEALIHIHTHTQSGLSLLFCFCPYVCLSWNLYSVCLSFFMFVIHKFCISVYLFLSFLSLF